MGGDIRYLGKTISVLMLIIFISAIISSSAWGLPPVLEAKKNWLGVENALEKDDYAKALEYLENMNTLGVKLKPDYYFQYGRSLIKSGKSSKGLDYLNRYIEKAGEEGEYVEWALELMNEGEEQVAIEKKDAEALEKERQRKAEVEEKRRTEIQLKDYLRQEKEEKRLEAEAKERRTNTLKAEFAELTKRDVLPSVSADERLKAWTGFLTTYPNDNPHVADAQERRVFWKHVVEGPYQGGTPPKMALIPAGKFVMGSEYGKIRTKPAHTVLVDRFFIDQYEVTQAEYEKVWKSNPSESKGADLPVESLTWAEATMYCVSVGKRLPTEAEWEKAARAGTTTDYYWGNDAGDSDDYAWTEENSGGLFSADTPHPVGKKKPNAFGLYDMSGNVWEWVSDLYEEGYYRSSPNFNPQGPKNGSERSIRGGSFLNDPHWVRTTSRTGKSREEGGTGIGFRCASTNPNTR